MKLITCIKQVPASSEVSIDPDTGVLVRDGKNVKMNPYDLYALEASFVIGEMSNNAHIHAITMGPPSAQSVLREALHTGADDATLMTDKRFAGADVWATSYTLAQMIKKIGSYDLVVCGKQTTDGDTAQVGPEIAECLGIPHVPYVKEVLKVTDREITVKSGYDGYEEIVQVKLPCLITIEKGTWVPRLPSYLRKKIFQSKTIASISLSALEDNNPEHYGLFGSPTQVEAVFPPDRRQETKHFNGNGKLMAEVISEILKKHRFL